MKSQCINEETMMDYLEGRLLEKQRSKVEKHLIECDTCLEEIKLVKEMKSKRYLFTSDNTDLLSVSEHVIQKTINAVDGIKEKSLLDTLVRITRTAVGKCMDELTGLFTSQASAYASVRGSKNAVSDDLVRIERSFGSFGMALEIEKKTQETVLIKTILSMTDISKDTFRITLLKDNREVSSYIVSREPVIFEDIPYGEYQIIFKQNNKEVGEYSFKIEDDVIGNK